MNDLLERALWTAVEAAAGALAVSLGDLPLVWAPVIATLLSAVKTYAKARINGAAGA